MRCFIALELPKDVMEYLASMQREFRGIPGASIVQRGNLHVTLAFLGEVKEESLEEVIRKTECIAANFRVFECALVKLEAIPARMPRLLWVSLSCENRLGELHDALSAALLPQVQKFNSHITLARIKNAAAARQVLQKANGINVLPNVFRAERVNVMKSVLVPGGPVYSVIKQVKLLA